MSATTSSPCRIDAKKGRHRHRCSREHADLVQAYRDARHVYELAREDRTLGYATEMTEDRSVVVPVTFGRWLIWSRGDEVGLVESVSPAELDEALASWQ